MFGKSVASKYEEVAASLGPSGIAGAADPITWAALRMAIQEWQRVYLPKVTFVIEPDTARKVMGNEAFRLVNDGYILGRIEVKSDGKPVGFSGLVSGDPAYEAGEFAMVAARAIAAGMTTGSFSGPPPSDVSKLLTQFALDAGHPLIDYIADDDQNFRVLGEANGRAVNLGREIALIEDFYVNPKKRR